MRKLFSIIAAVLFAGSMMAADATIAKGTTNSYDDVTINSKKAIKMGKSGAGGNMYITVGANATSLTFHAVAWKGEGNQKITIAAPTGVTVSKTEITAAANDNLTGSGKAFEVTPESDYEFTVTLTGVESEGAQLTLTSAKRAIVWAATYEAGAAPAVSKPTFEPKDSEFEGAVTVALACETAGASIFFTLDGSEPATEAGGATQAYSAPFTITKTATIKAIAVKGAEKSAVAEKTYTKLVYTQYEVAEAIAAGLEKGAPLQVRGVVTKIELTPKNFVKYGSIIVWVKDATGAAGEFEFYQCYSLAADTFRTATPTFDPTSGTVFSATSVSDGTGNTLTVGDTVVGKGRYELYEKDGVKTYELQKNCYLTSIIEGEGPAPVDIDIQSGVMFSAGVEEDQHFWQIQAENDDYYVTLAYVGTSTSVAGTYTEADLYDEYSYIYDYNADAKIEMASANLVVTVNADGTEADLAGTFVGDNGTTYSLKLHYVEPTPKTTVTVTIDDAELDTEEANEIGVMGEDATGLYVQLYIYTDEFEGSFDENDLDPQYSAVWLDDTHTAAIYTAEIEVVPADNIDNGYRVTADLLCYNNTLYKVTMIVAGEAPAAINNVENVKSNVMKAIENGHLFINVNGVRYNVNGAIVK